jgi:Kef-type K+ transport system membrane component KefB
MSTFVITIQEWTHSLRVPILALIGLVAFFGLYSGRLVKLIKLPSIIGFMLVGVLLGPSLFGIIDENMSNRLGFIADIALGFVALSIGLELDLTSLKKLGGGIITVIFAESLLAFIFVTALIYLLTRDLPLALIFGSIAPASAPAGTVAVIQEYRTKGKLTQALYAVVGFDDGLGIVIFGFAAAIARSILERATGESAQSFWILIGTPLLEVGLSFVVGGVASLLYIILARTTKGERDTFILTFAIVLMTIGAAEILHLSLILTNLIVGMVIVNTQQTSLTSTIRNGLTSIMPLLFVLFFVLAGSNLHISALPSLGLIGVVYLLSRTAGLMGGAWLGSVVGKLDKNIQHYLGLGILSQAGVAIGLSLIVKQEFSAISDWGATIGAAVITTVTATSIIFEIIGPITCKFGLKKAGEIRSDQA